MSTRQIKSKNVDPPVMDEVRELFEAIHADQEVWLDSPNDNLGGQTPR